MDATPVGVVGHCNARTIRFDNSSPLIFVIPGMGHPPTGGLLDLLVSRGIEREGSGVGAVDTRHEMIGRVKGCWWSAPLLSFDTRYS